MQIAPYHNAKARLALSISGAYLDIIASREQRLGKHDSLCATYAQQSLLHRDRAMAETSLALSPANAHVTCYID